MEPLLLVDRGKSTVLPNIGKGRTDCFKSKQQLLLAAAGQDDGADKARYGEGHHPAQVVADHVFIHLLQLASQKEGNVTACTINIITRRPSTITLFNRPGAAGAVLQTAS